MEHLDKFSDTWLPLSQTIVRLVAYPFVYRGIDPDGQRIETAIADGDLDLIQQIVRAHRTLFDQFPASSDQFYGLTQLIYRAIDGDQEGIADYFYFQLRDHPDIYHNEWQMLLKSMISLGRWDWVDRLYERHPIEPKNVLHRVIENSSTDETYHQQLIEYRKRFSNPPSEELTLLLTYSFSARSCRRLVDLGAVPSIASPLYPRYRHLRAERNWTTTLRLLRFIVFAQRRWRQLRQLADPVPFRLEM